MSNFGSIVRNYSVKAGLRFADRLLACPEAAHAEAAVFEVLTSLRLSPQSLEEPDSGGCDFECNMEGKSFAVEVTALTNEILSQRCGMRHDDFTAGNLDTASVLSLLRSRISSKGSSYQATRYNGSRVLAIVAEHYLATVLFEVCAPELLTGQQMGTWQVGPTGLVGEPYTSTKLKHAAHLRENKAGELELFRSKHALILLVAVQPQGCYVIGVANPKPDHALPAGAFATVPTAQLDWPASNRLRVAWSHKERPLAITFEV